MNGWTNRETWLINLWFAYDNQEELDDIKNMVMRRSPICKKDFPVI